MIYAYRLPHPGWTKKVRGDLWSHVQGVEIILVGRGNPSEYINENILIPGRSGSNGIWTYTLSNVDPSNNADWGITRV